MAIKTYAWDGSLYADDNASRPDVLAHGLADCDPTHLRQCMGTLARAIGMTDIARLAGVPRAHLYEALRAAEDGDAAPLSAVAQAARLALEPVVQAA